MRISLAATMENKVLTLGEIPWYNPIMFKKPDYVLDPWSRTLIGFWLSVYGLKGVREVQPDLSVQWKIKPIMEPIK